MTTPKRIYILEGAYFKWFKSSKPWKWLEQTSPIGFDKSAPKVKEVSAPAPKQATQSKVKQGGWITFFNHVETVQKWWNMEPPSKGAPVPAQIQAITEKPEKPIEPFDIQDAPLPLESVGWKRYALWMRRWFASKRHSVANEEQKQGGTPSSPLYPADMVDTNTLKKIDLLKDEQFKKAYDAIRSDVYLQSPKVKDAIKKMFSKISGYSKDIEPFYSGNTDRQYIHNNYCFASINVGDGFLENLEDIRLNDKDQSSNTSGELEAAFGSVKLYACIYDAHIFYHGNETRQVKVKSVAFYIRAPFGFDTLPSTQEFRGHFNKKHLALATDGKWANKPIYVGDDPYAKNAVYRPLFNSDFVGWAEKNSQGGDFLVFSEIIVPNIIPIDVVIPMESTLPKFKIVGRQAGLIFGALGILGNMYADLHLTLLIIEDDNIFGIDGQPTAFEAGLSNFKLIKVNYYNNILPDNIVKEFYITPPDGMLSEEFSQKLKAHAAAFASYTVNYSVPKNVVSATMRDGEYNSGSFLAGLLHSVMGYVPDLNLSSIPWNAPGWDNPIPDSYFKGEAIR
jgi:Family of unknown function (DUF6402)